MGGAGAPLALTAGYVLAAFLHQHRSSIEQALGTYEAWMRPLVDDVQSLPAGLKYFAYPQSRLGLAARGLADKVLTSAPFRPVAARLTRVAETEQELPLLAP